MPSTLPGAIRVVALLTLTLLGPHAVQAADPLVWKFEPNAVNRYRMLQTMNMNMEAGGNTVGTKLNQEIDMSWKVKETKDDGSAVLEQKIDRMKMTIEAGGQTMVADSASEEAPEGPAAMLDPLLKAMTSGAFVVTMTSHGEITEVDVPEKMIEALKNSPGAAMMGEMASEEGFKKLIRQASFVTPETLEPNTAWTTKMEMDLPNIGKQISETTYKYTGPKEVEGMKLESFEPTLTMRYEGGQTKIDVANQKSSGEILFNREEGRLEKSQLEQSMELTLSMGPQTIKQTLDQTVEMKWVPEGEAEAK